MYDIKASIADLVACSGGYVILVEMHIDELHPPPLEGQAQNQLILLKSQP